MRIDEDFLKEVGLSVMPDEQKKAFLAYAEEELEVRIGEKISEGVDPEKLKEFENLNDDAAALAWLKENKPDFAEIVEKTIEELKQEISANREKILA